MRRGVMPSSMWIPAAIVFSAFSLEGVASAPPAYRIIASSFLGVRGSDDAVVGARIQSDGTIVLAADIGPGIERAWSARKIVLGAPDGHGAAIAGGEVVIFDARGREIGRAKGRHFTRDVCVDAASRTVVFCGFRHARAWDGQRTHPVQIAYIHGLTYAGQRKWVDYDGSTDRDSDRFLNRPENNMADTRGDRCAIGRDGRLDVTFQVAGGNPIFRYSPKDIAEKVEIVGGDRYHAFYNSRAEHKCFFARYDPATGAYLRGQQFCGRLGSGRANAVVTKTGEIQADALGRVYVVGVAAYGPPLDPNPGGEEGGKEDPKDGFFAVFEGE